MATRGSAILSRGVGFRLALDELSGKRGTARSLHFVTRLCKINNARSVVKPEQPDSHAEPKFIFTFLGPVSRNFSGPQKLRFTYQRKQNYRKVSSLEMLLFSSYVLYHPTTRPSRKVSGPSRNGPQNQALQWCTLARKSGCATKDEIF